MEKKTNGKATADHLLIYVFSVIFTVVMCLLILKTFFAFYVNDNNAEIAPLNQNLTFFKDYKQYVSLEDECRPSFESGSKLLLSDINVESGDLFCGAYGIKSSQIAQNKEYEDDRVFLEGVTRPVAENDRVIDFERRKGEAINGRVVFYDKNKDADSAEFTAKIEFRIIVLCDDLSETAFADELDPQNKDSEKQWMEYKIPLDKYEGKVIDILLTADGENSDESAVWSVPYLESNASSLEKIPKNLIMICLDTLRADHIHCYGYPRAITPSIDQLSREALLFSNMQSLSSWTLPSMLTFLTGQIPSEHQTLEAQDTPSPENITFLAEFFHEASYKTAAFTGGGYMNPWWGFAEGFDIYNFQGKGAEAVFDRAQEYLNGFSSHQPFFLFIHTYEIHRPYNVNTKNRVFTEQGSEAPIPFGSSTEKVLNGLINHYDDGIRYTDGILGNFIRYLKRKNLYKDTGIVLFSDHGEEFAEHGGFFHGYSVFREVMEIPFIFKPPVESPYIRIVNEKHSSRETLPTLIRLYRLRKFGGNHYAFFDFFSPQRNDRYYYGFGKRRADIVVSASTKTHKFIYDSKGTTQLFDTQADPGELHPLKTTDLEEGMFLEAVEKAAVSGESSVQIWYEVRDQQDLSFRIKSKAMPENLTAYFAELHSSFTLLKSGELVTDVLLTPDKDMPVCGMIFQASQVTLFDFSINGIKLDDEEIASAFDAAGAKNKANEDPYSFILQPQTPGPKYNASFKSDAAVNVLHYRKPSLTKGELENEELKEQLKELGYFVY